MVEKYTVSATIALKVFSLNGVFKYDPHGWFVISYSHQAALNLHGTTETKKAKKLNKKFQLNSLAILKAGCVNHLTVI